MRVAGLLALVIFTAGSTIGCSLNPQPLPPDQPAGSDGGGGGLAMGSNDAGAVKTGMDAGFGPDAASSLDASLPEQGDASAKDAGVTGEGGTSANDAGEAGQGDASEEDSGEAGQADASEGGTADASSALDATGGD